MFVKATLKSLGYFPPKAFVYHEKDIKEITLTNTNIPMPITGTIDSPDPLSGIIALVPVDNRYRLLKVLRERRFDEDDLAKSFQQLTSGKEQFLAECATFMLLRIIDYNDRPRREFESIKNDVLELFEEYQISKELRDQIAKEQIVIPLGLVDLANNLGYQLYLWTDNRLKLLVGVNGRGLRYEWSDPDQAEFYYVPWKDTFSKLVDYRIDQYIFPILVFNILTETNTTGLHGMDWGLKHGVTVAGVFLHSLVNPEPLRHLRGLTISSSAFQFEDRIHRLLPDDVIDKLRRKRGLTQDEVNSLTEFLKIASTLLSFSPTYQEPLERERILKLLTDDLNLKLIGIHGKPPKRPRIPEEVFTKAGFKLTEGHLKWSSDFPDTREIIGVAHENEVYIIVDPGYYSMSVSKLTGTDLAPIKERVLKLMYKYD